MREGVEKIKTIGDAYMVAGGLPEPGRDHSSRGRMALAMRNEIARCPQTRLSARRAHWDQDRPGRRGRDRTHASSSTTCGATP